MAIGTKVKVGWDASAVKSGMSKLKSSFGMISRGMRQVGIGAARRLGSDLFGFIVQAGTAIPREIARLAQYSAELRLVAGDTKTATSEVLAMQKAMELSGMSTDIAADTFREFATKMGEAIKEANSEPGKALKDLNLFPAELSQLNVTQQISAFADAIAEYKGTQQDLAFIMDRFLGGDLGLRAISFFQNYGELMKEGRDLTKGFSEQLNKQAGELQNIMRLQSAFRQKFSELALSILGPTRGMTDGFVSMIENLDISGVGSKIGDLIRNTLIRLREEGFEAIFKDMIGMLEKAMKNLGKMFAEGIKSSMGDFSITDLLKPKIPGFGGPKDKTSAMIENNTSKTNELLDSIMRKNKTALFA